MSVMVKSVDDCFAFTRTNQLDPGSMFLIVIFLNSTASTISKLTLAPPQSSKINEWSNKRQITGN